MTRYNEIAEIHNRSKKYLDKHSLLNCLTRIECNKDNINWFTIELDVNHRYEKIKIVDMPTGFTYDLIELLMKYKIILIDSLDAIEELLIK